MLQQFKWSTQLKYMIDMTSKLLVDKSNVKIY